MNITTIKEEITEEKNKKTIITKPNFLLTRNEKNNYQVEFIIENKHIYVQNILGFQFIQLMYEVNKNMFETVQLDMIDENEAHLYLLMKPVMKELGVLQRFAALKLNMHAVQHTNTIYFKGVPYPEYQHLNQCKNAIIAPIKEITIACNVLTPHKFKFTQNIMFDSHFTMMPFFENIFGTFIKNMFQQTIEAVQSINPNT